MANIFDNFIIIILIIISFIVNISSNKKTYNFDLEIEIKEEEEEKTMSSLFIKSNDKICAEWIPSLFYPISIFKKTQNKYDIITGDGHESQNLYNPSLDLTAKFLMYYGNISNEELNTVLGEDAYSVIKKCYFGISSGLPKNFNENHTLDYLVQTNQLDQKIFSFDKWNIKGINEDESIISKLYLGYSHNDFDEKNKNFTGICDNIKEEGYWGCYFNEMIFNSRRISLKKEENDDVLYKVYISSENNNIIFPNTFKNLLNDGEGKCEYNIEKEATYCYNLFDNKLFIPLTLSNENMNITIEIDSIQRYIKEAEKEETNIIFKEENDYLIFPMIMFKNFHVLFDADNTIIKFYSNDTDILQVKEEDKNNDEDKDTTSPSSSSSSSTVLKVFLIILIIAIIIGLGLFIFIFIRKRRNNVEKNINKFTKFEDEEDFKNLNENKVY